MDFPAWVIRAAKAVPRGSWVTWFMAFMMTCKCLGFTSSEPRASSSREVNSPRVTTSRAKCGTTCLPPLTICAVIVASCRGVVRTKPWPIPASNVSPNTQGCPITARFQAFVGTNPEREPGISSTRSSPRPNRVAIFAILSIPTLRAIS